MKQVSEQWAALEKTDKSRYAQMATTDKKRFESEIQFLRSAGKPRGSSRVPELVTQELEVKREHTEMQLLFEHNQGQITGAFGGEHHVLNDRMELSPLLNRPAFQDNLFLSHESPVAFENDFHYYESASKLFWNKVKIWHKYLNKN